MEEIKPKKIRTWKELSECKSDTHKLKVNIKEGYAWIKSKNSEAFHYLSTHTFYESTYTDSTEILQKCGFNVELVSWGQ